MEISTLRRVRVFGPVAVLLLSGAGIHGAADGGKPPSEGLAIFRGQIRPLLTGKCLACHGADKKKGGLDLSRRGPAAGRGRERAGRRPRANRRTVCCSRKSADKEMPPKNPLTPEQVGCLQAVDRRPAPLRGRAADVLASSGPGRTGGRCGRSAGRPLPPCGCPAGCRTPDRRLHPGQARRAGPAARPRRPTARTLIRRRHVRPDRPAADAGGGRRLRRRPGPDAYERLVDRLLASPALRRALGPALARRRPLRREPRLRDEHAPPQRLAVPRLRHPRLQRRHAVSAVRPRAAGRRRAARTATG